MNRKQPDRLRSSARRRVEGKEASLFVLNKLPIVCLALAAPALLLAQEGLPLDFQVQRRGIATGGPMVHGAATEQSDPVAKLGSESEFDVLVLAEDNGYYRIAFPNDDRGPLGWVETSSVRIVATPTEPEQSDPPREALRETTQGLEGRWLLVGESTEPRAGYLQLDPHPDGPGVYSFLKRYRLPSGERREEAGRAERVGDRLRFSSDTASGITAALGPKGTTSQQVSANYLLSPDGQTFSGEFTAAGTPVKELLYRPRAATDNNRLELLIDGEQAFSSIRAAIENARHTISIETFIWYGDETGKAMIKLLGRKAKEGVKVRVLLSSVSAVSAMLYHAAPRLRRVGVEVILSNRLTSPPNFGIQPEDRLGQPRSRTVDPSETPLEARGPDHHDHRKILVVDGWVGFTGGFNMGMAEWHDVHCRVEGTAATTLEALFFERWRIEGGKGEPGLPVVTNPWPGQSHVEVLVNTPELQSEVTDRYLEEIARAQDQILIENPYILYDPIVRSLKERARAGVRVVLILPADDKNDAPPVRDAFQHIQNELVLAGVEVYKYNRVMTHGKVSVFDQVASVGSANFDVLSMEKNLEVQLFVSDPAFAQEVKRRVFDADIPLCDRVELKELHVFKRFHNRLMHFFRKLL